MIKYLKLNSREEFIFNNADYFTLWSKKNKFQFSNLTEAETYIAKQGLSNKFIVYAVMDNSDASIGYIN